MIFCTNLLDESLNTLVDNNHNLKILANGELTKTLTVKANCFSASARSKIEAIGGTCETV